MDEQRFVEPESLQDCQRRLAACEQEIAMINKRAADLLSQGYLHNRALIRELEINQWREFAMKRFLLAQLKRWGVE